MGNPEKGGEAADLPTPRGDGPHSRWKEFILIFFRQMPEGQQLHGQQKSSVLFPWVILKYPMFVALVITMARH